MAARSRRCFVRRCRRCRNNSPLVPNALDDSTIYNEPMLGRVLPTSLALILTCAAVIQSVPLSSEVVPVRYREGLIHGFLALSTIEGEVLAYGDLTQVVTGDRVTLRLVFHFKDGSLHDEATIYSERGSFRLLKYHLIQKGPAFKRSMDFSFDGSTGKATARYTDDDGKDKIADEQLKVPPDVANGITLTLLKNISPSSAQTTLSYVAPTPKPRLVKLVITPQGEDSFSFAGSTRKATHFVVKVDIGGVAGIVAPLVGKQPSETHIWILGGEAPAFVKSEGALYLGGPIWRIELASPVWPKNADSKPQQ